MQSRNDYERDSFELLHREGLARIGALRTQHGVIETPTVLPVINPNLNVIDLSSLRRMGLQGVITNSYIIRRSENLRETALRDGVHALIGFDGPVMTDSGTFQSYVYGDFEYDNRSQVEFQRDIGSDIATIVDVFSTPEDPYERARYAVMETHRRFLEVRSESLMLAAPVQGSVYPDLRHRAAVLMNSARPEYIAIGGVVPLLESYRYGTLISIIASVKKSVSPSLPVHLFGAGHPMFIPLAVLLGVDLFDSSSYIKYARDDRLLFQDGTRDLSRVYDLPFWSPLCGKYTADELRTLDPQERVGLLAQHNLSAIFYELSEIKERIREQSLWNYVEMRARAHPSLMEAFRRIRRMKFFLPAYGQSLRHPFLYFGPESRAHPIVRAIRSFTRTILSEKRVESLVVPLDVIDLVDPKRSKLRSLYEDYNLNLLISWNGIPVPAELYMTYPVLQSIGTDKSKSLDREQIRYVSQLTHSEVYEYPFDLEKVAHLRSPTWRNFDVEAVRLIARYQFGLDRSERFIPDNAAVRVSRKTGRIRTVQIGDEIIATLRPADGLLTLTMSGALRLFRHLPEGRKSVSVSEESSIFNRQGRNVFSRFVTYADPHIVPGDEVIVTHGGEPVAVGRATLTGIEMVHFNRGVAVLVNHHLSP